MAEKLDEKEVVSSQELLMAQKNLNSSELTNSYEEPNN